MSKIRGWQLQQKQKVMETLRDVLPKAHAALTGDADRQKAKAAVEADVEPVVSGSYRGEE